MSPAEHRARLITELTESGDLGPVWRDAFEQVPRHEFVPDTIWEVSRQASGRLVPLRRADRCAEWLERVYRDAPVDTQVDDGRPAPDGTGWEVTSSASQPSVVARMLTALDVEHGMRVLEIGAGTGWNAALLAHRIGAENVITVEIDPEVAAHARERLVRAGASGVTVVTGDGTRGWPPGGPFDRVLATVSVTAVPPAWVSQTKPGGLVVAPLRNAFHPPGLAIITVRQDGTAVGRLGDPFTFMGLRGERVPRPDTDWIGTAETRSVTDLHPHRWAGVRDAALAVGQTIGDGVHTFYSAESSTAGVMWLLDPARSSWASVRTTGGPPYVVEQAGHRRLFGEVAAAYDAWRGAGEPSVADWTVRVDRDGQRISCDRAAAASS